MVLKTRECAKQSKNVFSPFISRLLPRQAFTIAEILIVIGIIGVVAAITISQLVKNTNNAELKTTAKKAYSEASQAYLSATIENGGGFGNDSNVVNDGPGRSIAYSKLAAIKSKLKVIKECSYNSGTNGKCWADSGVGIGDPLTDCVRLSTGNQNINEAFVTADGMNWMLYTYAATSAQPWLAVDVNGNKKPNDWGKDVFIFMVGDTTVKPSTYTCTGYLKHNDGSTVIIPEEFQAPFK